MQCDLGDNDTRDNATNLNIVFKLHFLFLWNSEIRRNVTHAVVRAINKQLFDQKSKTKFKISLNCKITLQLNSF